MNKKYPKFCDITNYLEASFIQRTEILMFKFVFDNLKRFQH